MTAARHLVAIEADELLRIRDACVKRLDYLDATLPGRFQPAVQMVRKHASVLFGPKGGHPWVPVLGDLGRTSLLVNQTTGRLQGVVDLAGLCLLPLGMDFYAVDEIVGRCAEDGWHEESGAAAVRARFWGAFMSYMQGSTLQMEHLKAAWLAGILFRYGTPRDAGFAGLLGTLDDSTTGYQVLDGLMSRFAL